MTRSIADTFASYRADVIPADASDVQVEECRRAFYAAAYSILMLLLHVIGGDDTSEDQGVAILEGLKRECETFAQSIAPVTTDAGSRPIADPASGYQVRAPAIETLLRELGNRIRADIPAGWGFTLFLFSYGPTGLAHEGAGGSTFYLSTANRDDMVQALREFIQRQTH